MNFLDYVDKAPIRGKTPIPYILSRNKRVSGYFLMSKINATRGFSTSNKRSV